MDPKKAITYHNSKTNKKGIYRTFVTNDYPPHASSASFNQLIYSGIVHPTGVLIVPFLAPERGTLLLSILLGKDADLCASIVIVMGHEVAVGHLLNFEGRSGANHETSVDQEQTRSALSLGPP